MSSKPPFTDLEINRSSKGFYEGHSVEIALISKAIMIGLVLWALIWPENANSVSEQAWNWSVLGKLQTSFILSSLVCSSSSWSCWRCCRRRAICGWGQMAKRLSFRPFRGSQ